VWNFYLWIWRNIVVETDSTDDAGFPLHLLANARG
jgi:hypothetical protein